MEIPPTAKVQLSVMEKQNKQKKGGSLVTFSF